MKAWAIGIAVVVLLGVLAFPFVFGPSDQQLIQQALDDSVAASREGRPGGVLEYLSHSLKYNDEAVGNRSEVATFIKNSHPQVVIENPTPTINGNTATIVSPVTLTFGLGPVGTPVRLQKVEITLSKETGTRFLILPSPKWRVSEVKADANELQGLAGF